MSMLRPLPTDPERHSPHTADAFHPASDAAGAEAPRSNALLAARWPFWAPIVAEGITAFGAAGLLAWLGRFINVDPLDRVGQVSGLAAIGLRFTLAGLFVLLALHVASRVRAGAGFAFASRLACAALAGLVTGFVAAGIVVALRGTDWCLYGNKGDASRLAQWSNAVLNGQPTPYYYPPLPLRTIAFYSRWFELPTAFALKHLQIIGTLAFGPIAYLSWRLMLSPFWALAIGVVASLPLVDPYKPYANTALIVLVPLLVRFLQSLQAAGSLPHWKLAVRGAAFGVAFALVYFTYFGWFQWSAPGAVCAALLVFPWRRAAGRGACLAGTAAIAFFALAGRSVWRALHHGFKDDFFYFDTQTEPAYFAMWRWDQYGSPGHWPPLGELGGVGLFTLLVAIGIGVAVALGRRHALVTGLGCLIAGAWLLRFWYAAQMWQTKLVQLYPRTSIELLYCSLLMCGYAVYLVAARPAQRGSDEPVAGTDAARVPSAPALLGALCGLLLVLGSAGSALADRYMPANEKPTSLRVLAWVAHHTPPPGRAR